MRTPNERSPRAQATDAAARESERFALDQVLARMETAHGPVDEGAVAAIMRRLLAGHPVRVEEIE